MDARDIQAMTEALAEGVVAYSPVTVHPIRGRESVGRLLEHLMHAYEYWECVHEGPIDDLWVMIIRGRIAGREVEIVDLMREDGSGKVVEMRLHGRPMSAIAGFAAAVGPDMARDRGRVNGWLVALLAKPLPRLLAAGDRVVLRLAIPRD